MPSFAKSADNDDNVGDISRWFEQDSTAKQALEACKEETRLRAKYLLTKAIPAKIQHLAELIAQEDDPSSPLWRGHRDSGQFVKATMDHDVPPKTTSGVKGGGDGDDDEGQAGKRWYGHLEADKALVDTFLIVNNEFEDIKGMLKEIQDWIWMEDPQEEDGNTFGVSVQNSVWKSCQQLRDNAYRSSQLAKDYFADRAKIGVRWCRYPNVEDHAYELAWHNRDHHFLAIDRLKQIRGGLMMILNKCVLNFEKLYAPKGHGSHAGGMY